MPLPQEVPKIYTSNYAYDLAVCPSIQNVPPFHSGEICLAGIPMEVHAVIDEQFSDPHKADQMARHLTIKLRETKNAIKTQALENPLYSMAPDTEFPLVNKILLDNTGVSVSFRRLKDVFVQVIPLDHEDLRRLQYQTDDVGRSLAEHSIFSLVNVRNVYLNHPSNIGRYSAERIDAMSIKLQADRLVQWQVSVLNHESQPSQQPQGNE